MLSAGINVSNTTLWHFEPMPTMLSFKVIGMIGVASYAVAYLCSKRRRISYHRYKLITVAADQLPDMPRGYSWRELGPAELAEFTIDIDVAAQAARFAGGLRCLGTFDRTGALVGVAWVTRDRHHEDDLKVTYRLPADAAWDTGLWIPEDKRMGRAFPAVWASLKDWLQREGLRWTFSSIADYNVPSILAHRRLGSKRLRYLMVLRLGPLQVTLWARPFVTILGRTRIPTVRLQVA